PAREGEIGLQHAAHLVDVLLHRFDLGTVADERELELEAGENGAQVVRNPRQHGGALLQRALDAALHLDEGDRRAANLARAAPAAGRTPGARGGGRGGSPPPWRIFGAAPGSRRIGRIWLRRNSTATVISTSEVPTIHARKMCELET